jgi:hypothetical protein
MNDKTEIYEVFLLIYLFILYLYYNKLSVFNNYNFIEFSDNPIKYILKSENRPILIIILQGIYLFCELSETITNNDIYGIISAWFMFLFGMIILIGQLYVDYNTGHYNNHLVIEALFYILSGIILLYYKYKKRRTKKLLNKPLL